MERLLDSPNIFLFGTFSAFFLMKIQIISWKLNSQTQAERLTHRKNKYNDSSSTNIIQGGSSSQLFCAVRVQQDILHRSRKLILVKKALKPHHTCVAANSSQSIKGKDRDLHLSFLSKPKE